MPKQAPPSNRVLRPRPAQAPSKKKITSKKLTQFTCFAKLSPELRDIIWKFALLRPRTIAIKESMGSLHFTVESNGGRMLPSPLMYTCFESREVALRRYKQAFGELLHGQQFIHLDWERDCIYFDSVFELRYLCNTHDYYVSRNEPLPSYFVHWQKKLRHLAVRGPGFGHVETSLMGHLRTLKTLTLQDQRKKSKAKSATLLKVV